MRSLSSRLDPMVSTPLVEALEPRQLLSGPPIFASPTGLVFRTGDDGSVRQVVVADFDGDGRNDLAAVLGQPIERQIHGADNRIIFYRALSDGTFAPPTTLAVVGTVDSIAPGKFTATPAGMTDLALLGEYNDFGTGYTLRVLRFRPETGTLHVVARERIALPPDRHSMVVGNVIGNVTDEIIVQLRSRHSEASAGELPVQVYIGIYGVAQNPGEADARIVLKTVVKQGVFTSNQYTNEVQLADIDGDSVQDVIFQPGADTRAWLRQRPGFAERRITLGRPVDAAVVTRFVDMDLDGLADRVMLRDRSAANTVIGVTTIEFGRGDGGFDAAVELPRLANLGLTYGDPSARLRRVSSVRDLDGDGRPDVFYAFAFATYELRFEGFTTLASSGSATDHTQGPVSGAEREFPFMGSGAAFGDVNNDGLPDLLEFWDSRNLVVHLNNS